MRHKNVDMVLEDSPLIPSDEDVRFVNEVVLKNRDAFSARCLCTM